jgi:hypothetical protein
MIFEVRRTWYTDKSTVSEVFKDGIPLSTFMLEDVVRMFKIFGKTAIPAGTYLINLTYSQRFGRYTPELIDVKNFTSIRWHPGNTSADTEGCQLPGKGRTVDTVLESAKAYTELYGLIHRYIADAMLKIEPVYVKVVDTKPPRLM